MPISRDVMLQGLSLQEMLLQARELRARLVGDAKIELQLRLPDYNAANCAPPCRVSNMPPDLRLAVVDFLIERVTKRLNDIDVEIPHA